MVGPSGPAGFGAAGDNDLWTLGVFGGHVIEIRADTPENITGIGLAG